MDYYENMQPVGYGEPVTPDFHWNWGAFMLNWVFGFANKAWLCFLCFVPLLHIVWIFVCGARAERWAWESGMFENGAAFRTTMRTWNRAGLLLFIVTIVVVVLYAVLGAAVFGFLHSQGYDISDISTF